MPTVGLIAAAAGGGRVTAAKPVLSYVGAGQWTITNYDPTYTYTLSGSGSRSGNTITVTIPSGTRGTLSVTAKTPRGVTGSATSTAHRQAYTEHTEYVAFTQCYDPCGNCRTDVDPHTWGCGCGSPCGDSGGGAWGDCICRGPGYSYQQSDSYSGEGFTWNGSEWNKST